MAYWSVKRYLINNKTKYLYYPGGAVADSTSLQAWSSDLDTSIYADNAWDFSIGGGGINATTGSYYWTYTTPRNLFSAPSGGGWDVYIYFHYYNGSTFLYSDHTSRWYSYWYTVPYSWDSTYESFTQALVPGDTVRWNSGNTYTWTGTSDKSLGATLSKGDSYGSYSQTIRPALSATGYTFGGWKCYSGAPYAGNVYDAGFNFWVPADYATSTTDYYFEAVWTANTYTVKYNANDGQGVMSDSTATYNQDFQTRKNTFTRTGYSFNGWNEKADGTGTAWTLTSAGVYESGKYWKWDYTSDITLYAQWGPITYSVDYNANEGTNAPKSQTKTYNVDLTLSSQKPSKADYKVTQQVTFSPEGGSFSSGSSQINFDVITSYKFKNWNTTSLGTGTSYASGGTYKANANVVLYAQYTSTTKTSEIILPSVVKQGSIFEGWYTAKVGGTFRGKDGDSYNPPVNGEVLYARWVDGTRVTFKLNGGGTLYHDEVLLIRTNSNDNFTLTNPTRDNYYFDGWNTNSNGTGRDVYTWTNISKCSGNNSSGYWTNNKWVYGETELTLFAKWVPVDSYVYWTDNKWHPICGYVYNNGWKELFYFKMYNGSAWVDGKKAP